MISESWQSPPTRRRGSPQLSSSIRPATGSSGTHNTTVSTALGGRQNSLCNIVSFTDMRVLLIPSYQISFILAVVMREFFSRSFRPDFLLVRQNFRDASEDHKERTQSISIHQSFTIMFYTRDFELADSTKIHYSACFVFSSFFSQ